MPPVAVLFFINDLQTVAPVQDADDIKPVYFLPLVKIVEIFKTLSKHFLSPLKIFYYLPLFDSGNAPGLKSFYSRRDDFFMPL